MSDCTFCDIVAGRAHGHVVYSDEYVVAFLDISPITSGHTLVVPRRHSSGLADLDPAIGGKIFAAGQRIAAAMRVGAVAADGVNLAMNDGRAASQTVFHSHLHVIPRHSGDKASFAKGLLTRRARDLDSVAAGLRAAIETVP
ncbi:HIT family protein [Gordonia sp. (in: high G+C Gram-positive bacteria)]|uniref:HIT family protein n=1 Tax=Gordonia sp. (in: high G+C Gram-positive bacteria) TaxID=84139 RepID=UPI00169B496A|nr:HIT family protein [Gordonia sp. (in: high G+C Gram-positive bacteria)]NLG47184.1 HIT family protein [Gordonia sp. (in: high G+C Gram-positive bacteria)]